VFGSVLLRDEENFPQNVEVTNEYRGREVIEIAVHRRLPLIETRLRQGVGQAARSLAKILETVVPDYLGWHAH
jgi:hypothetical protein